jgi:hypothetical protein
VCERLKERIAFLETDAAMARVTAAAYKDEGNVDLSVDFHRTANRSEAVARELRSILGDSEDAERPTPAVAGDALRAKWEAEGAEIHQRNEAREALRAATPACLDPQVCRYPQGRCVEPSRCSYPGLRAATPAPAAPTECQHPEAHKWPTGGFVPEGERRLCPDCGQGFIHVVEESEGCWWEPLPVVAPARPVPGPEPEETP